MKNRAIQLPLDLGVPSVRERLVMEANRLLSRRAPHVKESIDVPWDQSAPSYYPPSTYVVPNQPRVAASTVPAPRKVGKPRKKTGKAFRANDRIRRGGFTIPSPREIEASKSYAGAWSAAQLAEWGIPWSPIHGWRSYLATIWSQYGGVVHDTVFDDDFKSIWMSIPSGEQVPLSNVRSR